MRPRLSQSSIIAAALLAAYFVFITTRGELPYYLQVFTGKGPPAGYSTNPGGNTAGVNLVDVGGGGGGVSIGIELPPIVIGGGGGSNSPGGGWYGYGGGYGGSCDPIFGCGGYPPGCDPFFGCGGGGFGSGGFEF